VNVGCGLVETFILKQLLTAANYMYFITDKLSLLMENVPLETRLRMFFQHDGTCPYFCFQVMAKQESMETQIRRIWTCIHLSGHEPILQMETDKTITRNVYNKAFMVRFPDRSEWKDRLQPNRKGGLVWYADGTKINNGIGAGVYDYIQGRSLASTLDNTPQYSKQKSMPSSHVQ
jgi:hypothetical protein